eukprot:NODE_535_length_6333_cov_1.473051.p3 type:complete len:222 gc:universal NODE_535_length_6333_cov_1.473051:4217-3552(-)
MQSLIKRLQDLEAYNIECRATNDSEDLYKLGELIQRTIQLIEYDARFRGDNILNDSVLISLTSKPKRRLSTKVVATTNKKPRHDASKLATKPSKKAKLDLPIKSGPIYCNVHKSIKLNDLVAVRNSDLWILGYVDKVHVANMTELSADLRYNIRDYDSEGSLLTDLKASEILQLPNEANDLDVLRPDDLDYPLKWPEMETGRIVYAVYPDTTSVIHSYVVV